jgi:histone H1/5
LTLKERKGSRSSQQAIAKLIEDKHKKVLPSKFKKSLSVQLNKFVKCERLVKVNNSFKLSPTDNAKKVTHKTKKKAAHIKSRPRRLQRSR